MNTRQHTTKVYRDESRLFYIVLFSFLTVLALYIYFVSSSVVSVVMRKEIDGKIQDMNTHISKLESEYIEKQHEVSDSIATQQGFVSVTSKTFIDVDSSDTLVMRDH